MGIVISGALVITGRKQKEDKDVLYYHKRQAFLPGEIGHDGALEIGYETAMRWTKGKYAFFVVTHADRPTLMCIFIIIPLPSIVPGSFGIFSVLLVHLGACLTEFVLKTGFPILLISS